MFNNNNNNNNNDDNDDDSNNNSSNNNINYHIPLFEIELFQFKLHWLAG